MKPVSPVYSIEFQKHEVVFAKDQPEYLPLPALILKGEDKPVVSRWRLNDVEREKIAKGADILLTQNIFTDLYHPVRLEVADGVVE
jgi:hypothetical protein